MINDLINGKSKYSNIFNYPAKTWADIAVIGFLVDAGAIVNQLANAKGSYGPYCRALERICYEESFHLKQGYDAFVALAVGSTNAARDASGCAEPLVVSADDANCTFSVRRTRSPSTPKS